MENLIEKLIAKNILYKICLGGVVSIIIVALYVANHYDSPGTILIILNVGGVTTATVALQWMFDAKMKPILMRETAESVIGSINVVNAGIINCEKSRGTGYQEIIINSIVNSSELSIGRNWSDDLLENYRDKFEQRRQNGKDTTFIFLDTSPQNQAIALSVPSSLDMPHFTSERLVENRTFYTNNNETTIQQINDQRNGGTGKIETLWSKLPLLYAFILTEDDLWISAQIHKRPKIGAPMFRLRKDYWAYEYFREDIRLLTVSLKPKL